MPNKCPPLLWTNECRPPWQSEHPIANAWLCNYCPLMPPEYPGYLFVDLSPSNVSSSRINSHHHHTLLGSILIHTILAFSKSWQKLPQSCMIFDKSSTAKLATSGHLVSKASYSAGISWCYCIPQMSSHCIVDKWVIPSCDPRLIAEWRWAQKSMMWPVILMSIRQCSVWSKRDVLTSHFWFLPFFLSDDPLSFLPTWLELEWAYVILKCYLMPVTYGANGTGWHIHSGSHPIQKEWAAKCSGGVPMALLKSVVNKNLVMSVPSPCCAMAGVWTAKCSCNSKRGQHGLQVKWSLTSGPSWPYPF